MNEELIQKLRELRDRRNLEIYLSENENNKNVLYKHFVEDIKYLGDVNLENSDKEENIKKVFKITEQSVDKKGEIIYIEKYYTEDFELLGGNNKSDNYDFLILSSEYSDNEKLIEDLNNLPENGISLKEIENNLLKEIAKSLGIEEKEINSLSEMDLAQKIEEKEEARGTENDAEVEEEKEIDQEEMKQISNQKQEIKLDTKVDDKRTLGQALDLDTSEFTKVAVVYSDRLNEITDSEGKTNNTLYSFVAIRKDGTAVNISDRLQIDARTGNNQNRESIKIDADEQARKDNKTRTRFQIIGENGKNAGKPDYAKETLSLENGQYGEIKAYYGKGRSRQTRENIETQLETSSIKRTTKEFRSLQADRKGMYNTDKMVEEANSYLDGKDNDERVSMYNVDGNEYTVADGIDVFVDNHKDEWSKLIMDDPDVDDVFTKEEVEERIKRYWLNEYADKAKSDDGKIDKEEVENINEDIKRDIVKDAENIKEAQGRRR